jgi:hypothetical protein
LCAIPAAGWDETLLGAELAALRQEGFDVSLLGFADEELAWLLAAQDAAQGLTHEDAVPEVPQITVSTACDLWLLGRHRLLCGDATDKQAVSQLLGAVKPMLMVTDPHTVSGTTPSGEKSQANSNGKVSNDDRDWREAWAFGRSHRLSSVADTTIGSTTTTIACEKESRIALAIELEPAYVDVAVTPVAELHRQAGSTRGAGRTFDEVSVIRTHVSSFLSTVTL